MEYKPHKKRRSPTPPIDPITWDQYKETILWLYKEQGKKAQEVLEMLKADGFEPS